VSGTLILTDTTVIFGQEVSISVSDSIVVANRPGCRGECTLIDAGGIVVTDQHDQLLANNTASQDGKDLFSVDSTISHPGKTVSIHNQPNDCVGCQ
jgi:hypothetical protein